MSTITELQEQINALQVKINNIETDIMTGKSPIACPRAQQRDLMVQQQHLMQLETIVASGGVDNHELGNGNNRHLQGVPAASIESPKGIDRPPLPIPSQPAGTLPTVPLGSTGDKSLGTSLSYAIHPIAQYTTEINAASSATNVPADLIGAVIYKESQGNQQLISGKPTAAHRTAGIALGLMQVEPNTSPEIEAKHPEIAQLDGAAYDIMLGSWRLADLALEFDGWDTVLRAYNSGAWAPVLKDPSIPITTGDPKYVYLVNAWWQRLSSGRQLPADMDPDS